MGGAGSCPVVGEAGSCPSGGQAHAQEDFRKPSADGWGCVPTLLVVWPDVSQHWSLQAVGWGQVLGRK